MQDNSNMFTSGDYQPSLLTRQERVSLTSAMSALEQRLYSFSNQDFDSANMIALGAEELLAKVESLETQLLLIRKKYGSATTPSGTSFERSVFAPTILGS